MTRDEVLNMKAGVEMDAVVFANVFGKMAFRAQGGEWMVRERDYLEKGDAYYVDENQNDVRLPRYSSDILAAWEVVERINEMIFNDNLTLYDDYNYLTLVHTGRTTGYAASFDCLLSDEWFEDISKYKYAARGDSAPLAICRAALLAVMKL